MAHILPLKLEQVSLVIGDKTLVDRLSVEFEAGTRTLILGPNGAGKSLTLRLCHGLIMPTSGRIVWQGPGNARAHWRQAMVFQRPVMLRRSVSHNIDYALRIHGIPKPERTKRVDSMLQQTGLVELSRAPARVLSTGEQQRLALARAWALQPEVLFLDEPTSNLDPAASRSVERIIDAIHQSGTKIIMTTHDLGQARRLADDLLFLHRGRLVERSAAGPFFEQPSTPEADAFMRGELYW